MTSTNTGQPIPSAGPAARPEWQRLLADAVGDLETLLALLDLDPETLAADLAADDLPSPEALAAFPLRVPRGFVDRMVPGDPRDPLLRQVLPIHGEMAPADADPLSGAPAWSQDPLGEADVSPVPGLLHKYRGRVLMIATGACAVHCRYCFRRHFPYGEHGGGTDHWRRILEYIAADPSIEEVILSGGDPLVLADTKLARLAGALGEIPHLRRLRLHTRLPVVLPERVDGALLAWLTTGRLDPVVVIHCNHAQEIDASVRDALARLRGGGVTVLNQAVLLRGINDSVEALSDLSRALFETGVLPYYLHVLDRVLGAAHFEVPETVARQLIQQLRGQMSGYLVPHLVREEAGAPSKSPI